MTDKNFEKINTKIVSPRENQIMKIKSFHGAVQSNNVVFAGFKHVKF